MGTSIGTIKAGVQLTYSDTMAPQLTQEVAEAMAKRKLPMHAQLPKRHAPAVIPRRDYGPKQ